MKNSRQIRLLELISEYDIETQLELAERLNASGFKVTQATVSRDIKQLGLTKVLSGSGKMKYCAPDLGLQSEPSKPLRVLREIFISAIPAGTIVIVKTDVGCAMAAAAAIEAWANPLIVGSIAGDDTVFCATESFEDAKTAAKEINEILN